MIYITGDTHSEYERRLSVASFPEQKEMTKEDCVIIAGDFGGVWCQPGTKEYRAEAHQLDALDRRPFTTLWVPGNHENYDRLMSDEFETKEWHGGPVKVIRPSVLMLMRGEMYEIEGLKFFAFGGARSHDISDGILDGEDPDWMEKAWRMERTGRYLYRVKGLSWWEQEMPTEEEMQHGRDTLDRHGWQCDVVITHAPPRSVHLQMGIREENELADYLDEIRERLDYRLWFFGHYHDDGMVTEKDILLYHQIVRVV